MGNIIPFSSGEFTLQVIEINGEPWFVAADIASVLDYRSASDLTRNLDDDEKGTQIVRTPGGSQEMAVVNEAGLYAAILKSRKPEAKPFKRWVTHEVLPAIRRTGGYFKSQGEPRLEAAASDATAMFTFMRVIGLDQNAAAISANQAAYAVHGVNLLQLSGNTHLLAANQETQALTPTALGKLLGGLSAQKVNKALEEAGLQKRVTDEWVPLPAAEGLYRLFDTGKKHSSGTPVTQLKWYAAATERIKRRA